VGYRCIFVTTDKQSKEKADMLSALGAEVIVCPTNVEPDDPRSYYSVALSDSARKYPIHSGATNTTTFPIGRRTTKAPGRKSGNKRTGKSPTWWLA
jgi:cysteine synthase